MAGAARLLHAASCNSLGDPQFGMVLRELIGLVGMITPWNFPFLIPCDRVPFILAASLWTKTIDKTLTVTRRVRTGHFWVNCIMAGGPIMPFGGFKQSGWGRVAGSYGVEGLTQVQCVPIETGKRNHWIA